MGKQLLIGLAIVGIWWAVVYFSSYIADIFGRIERFEKNLGGTRNGLMLFGFGIIIIWLLVLFWVIPTTSPTENMGSLSTTS